MKRRLSDHELAEQIAKTLTDSPSGGQGPAADARVLLQRARDAGAGGVRAQCLAEAQCAIAKLDPVRHRATIQRLQADMLALQGRGGDTKMAHLTPGEIVVPRSLQTPQLLQWLRMVAQAQGIDPARLVVGSGRNSINPNTGQEEFLYGAPEIDNAPQQLGPNEQQVADIFVNQFPYDVGGVRPGPDIQGAPGFGHVGIGVNTPFTKGFYPAQSNLESKVEQGADHNVPGVVKDDDLTRPHNTFVIPTTPEQDQAVQRYIDERTANPGNYNLYDRQCTDFVAGGVRAGGQIVPSDSTPSIWDDMIPNRFIDELKRRYGPENK